MVDPDRRRIRARRTSGAAPLAKLCAAALLLATTGCSVFGAAGVYDGRSGRIVDGSVSIGPDGATAAGGSTAIERPRPHVNP